LANVTGRANLGLDFELVHVMAGGAGETAGNVSVRAYILLALILASLPNSVAPAAK
jgi:hypothetical protein